MKLFLVYYTRNSLAVKSHFRVASYPLFGDGTWLADTTYLAMGEVLEEQDISTLPPPQFGGGLVGKKYVYYRVFKSMRATLIAAWSGYLLP